MMSPELTALRDEAMRIGCGSWAIRKRWQLSQGIERVGPCPVCGGTDRFSINTQKDVFNCRRCGIAGQGVIDLVEKTEGVKFVKACEIITGRSAAEPVDETRMAELKAKAEADEAKRQADAERYREKARKQAYDIWRRRTGLVIAPGGSVIDGPILNYLLRRGIDIEELARQCRFVRIYQILAHRWREKQGDDAVTVHTGPAMIAAVVRPDGYFGAVHQTWIDLDQPKGKLALPPDAVGKERPSKKVLGSKKGGAIRLFSPGTGFNSEKRARRLVMGEGIETTLTALAHAYEPETAYWAGVDLGNMAGRAARDADGKILHGMPDMDDRECFLPPEGIEELIYLCDSDEPENRTVEKITRGLLRAAALNPKLTTWLVPPIGDGKDLNDLVRVEA